MAAHNFSDSRVAVTGAGRGLGRHLVDAILERGAGEVIGLARVPQHLQAHDRLTAVALDLAASDTIASAAEAIGSVDMLINNAAFAAFASALNGPMADIRTEFEVNVLGTLELTRAVSANMRPGGHLVNIMSLMAYVAPPGMAGYAATKHALHALTTAMRPELGQRGITVHGVYPGGIDTDMLAAFHGAKSAPAAVANAILDALERDEQDIYPDPESRSFASRRR